MSSARTTNDIVEINRLAAEALGADFRLLHGQPIDSILAEARNLKQRSDGSGHAVEALCEGFGNPLRVRCDAVLVEQRVTGALFIVSPVDRFTFSPSATERPAPAAGQSRAGTSHPGVGTLHEFSDILGTSAVLQQAIRLARTASGSDRTVLLTGETGSGKELFAHALHTAGPRRNKPFVVVDCAALPHELIESELFGYAPGAFTGARRQGSSGKFELANGRTIFLDEVSAMPLDAQPKLLRVLETKTGERLNSGTPIRVDVRIIAASNEDLRELCRQGKFRRDLFYRLQVFPIRVPSLRERREDIAILAQTFISKKCEAIGRPSMTLSPEMLDCLERYDWPGNVRIEKSL